MFKRFRCKVPMNLQKFAEGGSGDGGGAGGSAANGGTPPAGVQQTPQFDYDKLASLIAGKQTVTEESVLKGYFKQQGLSKEQMDQAIASFKQQQAANQPDVAGMQNQITEAQAQLASYLGERLNGLQFRPMEVDVPTDPAREAGDLGLITDARGRHYKTIFTNIEYTAHAAQKLTSGAEAPTRLSSVRYSQATRVYKELRANLKKQKTEWDTAFDELQSVMKTKNGLFPIRETQEDGSSILYFCDKPELSDASVVVKFSAAGWAMSTDGGKHLSVMRSSAYWKILKIWELQSRDFFCRLWSM